MLYAFLVTLREGLEAALIIGILLAYLEKSGQTNGRRALWSGVAAALLASLLGGLVLYGVAGGLSGKALEAFEGITMLSATVILSGMIIAMRRHAGRLRGDLSRRQAAGSPAGLRCQPQPGAGRGLFFLPVGCRCHVLRWT